MLRREVEQVVGEYLFDCTNFRTDDKDDLLRQVYEMTDRRFALADHLLRTKPWELFAMVEMGTDRMHHGFWKDMDAEHRAPRPGRPLQRRDPRLPPARRQARRRPARGHADEDTTVLVVSDHGAKRMDGGIRINEWLRREGLLRRCASPTGRGSLDRRRRRLDADRSPGARAATTGASS